MIKVLTKNDVIIEENLKYYELFGILSQKYKKTPNIFTTKLCKMYGNSTSKSKILKFIKKYEIDWENTSRCKNNTSLLECINKYKTLNDFFIRKRENIKIYKKRNGKYLVSPADCRTTYFKNVKLAKKLWIKGSEYNISSMLNTKKNDMYYNKCNIIISRLAPSDYHRFHSPINGTFVKKKIIKGDFYSVNPKIVQSKVNVYTKNTRVIYYINTTYFGIIAMSIIGATCVGSIIINKKKTGEKISKGEEIGYFQFGGSTIVTIVPYNKKIMIDKDIDRHSKKKIETYVKVGDLIGYLK